MKRLTGAWRVLTGACHAVSDDDVRRAASIATTLITSERFALLEPLADVDALHDRWDKVNHGIEVALVRYLIDLSWRGGFTFPSWEELEAERQRLWEEREKLWGRA